MDHWVGRRLRLIRTHYNVSLSLSLSLLLAKAADKGARSPHVARTRQTEAEGKEAGRERERAAEIARRREHRCPRNNKRVSLSRLALRSIAVRQTEERRRAVARAAAGRRGERRDTKAQHLTRCHRDTCVSRKSRRQQTELFKSNLALVF